LIARRVNRAPSTISRELARNTGKYSTYWYDWAQQYAKQRKKIARNQKRKNIQGNFNLLAHVLIGI